MPSENLGPTRRRGQSQGDASRTSNVAAYPRSCVKRFAATGLASLARRANGRRRTRVPRKLTVNRIVGTRGVVRGGRRPVARRLPGFAHVEYDEGDLPGEKDAGTRLDASDFGNVSRLSCRLDRIAPGGAE